METQREFLERYAKVRRNDSSSSVKDLLQYLLKGSNSDPLCVQGSGQKWIVSKNFRPSSKKERDSKSVLTEPGWIHSLDTALRSPTGLDRLYQYCEERSNTENLKFIFELQRYKFCSIKNVLPMFNDLIKRFIEYEAPNVINITMDVRNNLLDIFKTKDNSKINRLVFDAAEKQIFRLLDDDIFLNFKAQYDDGQAYDGKCKNFFDSIKSILASPGDAFHKHFDDKSPRNSRPTSPVGASVRVGGSPRMSAGAIPDDVMNFFSKSPNSDNQPLF